jgi:hypothetical protein
MTTTITARNRICVRAIMAFVEALCRKTTYRVTARPVSTPDIVFNGGDEEAVMQIEFQGGADADSGRDDDDEMWKPDWESGNDQEDDASRGPSTTLSHYLRTMRALARNAEASELVLRNATGRRPRCARAILATERKE